MAIDNLKKRKSARLNKEAAPVVEAPVVEAPVVEVPVVDAPAVDAPVQTNGFLATAAGFIRNLGAMFSSAKEVAQEHPGKAAAALGALTVPATIATAGAAGVAVSSSLTAQVLLGASAGAAFQATRQNGLTAVPQAFKAVTFAKDGSGKKSFDALTGKNGEFLKLANAIAKKGEKANKADKEKFKAMLEKDPTLVKLLEESNVRVTRGAVARAK